MGEKIITCIIQKGFELHSGSVKTFVERTQEIIRTQVLRSPEAPSQWKLPTKKAGEPIAIGDVTGSNTFIRVMMSGVSKIIEAVIPVNENDLRGKLVSANMQYSAAMELLTLHRPLLDEEINQFQNFADDFFEGWIAVFGHK